MAKQGIKKVGKLRSDQKGFSAVEILLVLVIVGLIGVVGYMVYRNHNKTTDNTATSTTKSSTSAQTKNTPTDPYAGWQTYSDSHVSFKYPSGWQAGTGTDKYAAVSVTATSPGFTTSAMTTGDNPGASVTFSLQLSTNSSTVYCSNDPCKVTAVVPLSNSQLPNSALAVVNQTSGNSTNYSQYVVVSDSTKVGDTTISASKAGSSSIYVFGQPYYTPKDGGLTVAARVTDTGALQADSHFKDLLNLINSTKFN
jgi:prepilin-type N-terminal cleavage/methylation domain-containing protein